MEKSKVDGPLQWYVLKAASFTRFVSINVNPRRRQERSVTETEVVTRTIESNLMRIQLLRWDKQTQFLFVEATQIGRTKLAFLFHIVSPDHIPFIAQPRPTVIYGASARLGCLLPVPKSLIKLWLVQHFTIRHGLFSGPGLDPFPGLPITERFVIQISSSRPGNFLLLLVQRKYGQCQVIFSMKLVRRSTPPCLLGGV